MTVKLCILTPHFARNVPCSSDAQKQTSGIPNVLRPNPVTKLVVCTLEEGYYAQTVMNVPGIRIIMLPLPNWAPL